MSPRVLASILLSCLMLVGCGGSTKQAKNDDGKSKSANSKKSSDGKQKRKGGKKAKASKKAAPEKVPAPKPLMLDKAEIEAGWISLFDGVTLFGWQAESEANWKVANGQINVSSGQKGLLRTTTSFGNYSLKLEFKSAAKTNSGIFLHTPAQPTNPQADCYELNIAPADNPFPTGSLVGRKKVVGDSQSDDWQSYEITLNDGHVVVKLDGKLVMDYTDPTPLRRGYIGLQLNEGAVSFRRIRLKPLDAAPIFNGKDLEGWKTYPKMDSRFSATPSGELHVQGGKGQLETQGQYDDFVLQLQCRTNARDLNSGIFFRCIPGDVMMGYESQIHNGFVDGDRTEPLDWGTGAIFRRVKARRIVADDLAWFDKTLIADGAHIAVWVNGYQVSDWTDDRKPNENPRRGLRLAAGTIMLQGHDKGTDVSFRKMRIAKIAPRSKVVAKQEGGKK